jgi:hypothetical protein
MGLPTLIFLAVVVVAAAYVVGTYLRQRDEAARRPRLRRTIDEQPRPSRGVKAALLQPFGSRELQAVVSWLLSQAFEQTGVKVADDKIAYQRIVEAAQKALEQLKTQETATISLPFLTADAAGPKHFETRLTREAIQELIKY